MNKSVYIHEEDVHNLDSPAEIVPVIMKLIKPKSVVDVGCGIGTFLYCFKQAGVKDVFGIDGPWVNPTLLAKYLDKTEFMEADLQDVFAVPRKFDLAISLEVAEHLKEASADNFVKNLTALSDVIIFSAALPQQGGQNHINEQWPEYWERKFNDLGFEFQDVLRECFWNNTIVAPWYKQNMFLVLRKGHSLDLSPLSAYKSGNSKSIIHPEFFNRYAKIANATTQKLELVENGDYQIAVYVKLLVRAISRKLGFKREKLPVLIFNKDRPADK